MSFSHSHEAIRATAVRYAKEFGWHPLPVKGKVPAMGTAWQRRTSSDPEAVRVLFSSDHDFDGLGVKLGPDSGIIDIECDSEEAESEFFELFRGEEIFTPTFRSSRGLHRLFKWPENAEFPAKAVFKIGAIEFRIGGGNAGAQSVFPPSAGREWETSPLEADTAELPKFVIDQVLARLAESKPKKKAEPVNFPAGYSSNEALDVPRWLRSRGHEVIQITQGDGVTRFHIVCPNAHAHTSKNANRDCCVTQDAGGKLGGNCFHQSCGMSDWQALKAAIGAPTYEDYHPETESIEISFSNASTARTPEIVRLSDESKDGSPCSQESEEERTETFYLPFPDALGEVPGLIGDMMRYNLRSAIYPRKELALASAIAFMSLITGRKIQDRWKLRTNLFVVGLCGSGSGKSESKKVNAEILGRLNESSMISHKPKSGSALVSSINGNPALLLQVDELSDWLETMKSPTRNPHTYEILSILKEVYSEANSDFWKPSGYADTKKNLTISNPHLVFYGIAPPSMFYQSLTKANLTDGLVGRFLIIESHGENRSNDDADKSPPDAKLLAAVKTWLDFTPEGAAGLGGISGGAAATIQHTPEAWARYRRHAKETEVQRPSDNDEAYALWCRTPEKSGKLAMLRACSRTLPIGGVVPAVELEDVEWGIAVANWCTRRALERAGLYVAENQIEANLLRLLRILDTWKSREQIGQETKWIKAKERDEMLRGALADGMVQSREVKTGGRQRLEFRRYRF